MTEQDAPLVELPQGSSASSLLHDVLVDATRRFDDVFTELPVPPSSAALKKRLGAFLMGFEQRRRASNRAPEIARHIVGRVHREMRFRGQPLAELTPAPGLEIQEVAGGHRRGDWTPSLIYDGEPLAGPKLGPFIDRLAERGHLGAGAAATLRRGLERVQRGGGTLDLSGERFALLGAGAEIAPTRALLAAGATVLWCDTQPPPAPLGEYAGRLLHANGRGDLLSVPDQIAHAVSTFAAEEGAIHLGMFAYAPGKGREWRLGAAMNAVARAIPEERLRSVGLYVSPTSPAMPEPSDVERAQARWHQRPSWQRALTGLGALRANRSQPSGPWIADTIVPVQGVSYQAAQYIEKTLAMEAAATERPAIRASAVVAPVTRTRSIEHPIFAAAFRGTRIFHVEAFAPEVTRTLCALMYVEDVLGERSPAPRYFHGGLFTLPFSLEGAIRVAALKGSVTRS